MNAAPNDTAKKSAASAIACDVAVIELLGPQEAETAAATLRAEARAGNGISVRTVLREGGGDDVPHRRRRATEGATAPVTYLIEDTTLLQPGWAAALCDIFADPAVTAACGPVSVSPDLPARYRALGRLEYGRFDGPSAIARLPGNAFAVRLTDLEQTYQANEGIIEHDLEQRLVTAGRKICHDSALTAVYAKPDIVGARLSTRFGHGRIYGAGRGGNAVVGVLKAALAMPALSLRALNAARNGGPARQWLPEIPWIILMATAWALGELTGQIAGKGNSERSWN